MVDRMFCNTSAGSSVWSAILCSRASWSLERPVGSGVSESPSMSCEESDGIVLDRLDTLLQNERREATVRATGEVVTENSEDGVEVAERSEEEELREDGTRNFCPGSAFMLKDCVVRGVIILTSLFGENWTRGWEPEGKSTSWSAGSPSGPSISRVSGISEGESKLEFGNSEGREKPALRECNVFTTILARSSVKGIAVTPLTP